MFWITDLSSDQRLDYYRKKIRPELKALSRSEAFGGVFEESIQIIFTEAQEKEHCAIMSPEWMKVRIFIE